MCVSIYVCVHVGNHSTAIGSDVTRDCRYFAVSCESHLEWGGVAVVIIFNCCRRERDRNSRLNFTTVAYVSGVCVCVCVCVWCVCVCQQLVCSVWVFCVCVSLFLITVAHHYQRNRGKGERSRDQMGTWNMSEAGRLSYAFQGHHHQHNHKPSSYAYVLQLCNE